MKASLAFLNVGTGIDLTIRELAKQVATAVGFNGSIHWDTSKPDGTPKKQLDVNPTGKNGLACKDFLKGRFIPGLLKLLSRVSRRDVTHLTPLQVGWA